MATFDEENKNLIFSCKFFSVLGHQTLDPDPESGSAIRKNAGSGSVSGSALNQCGSETLHKSVASSQKYDKRFSSRIQIFSNPGSRGQKGSGSRIRNTAFFGLRKKLSFYLGQVVISIIRERGEAFQLSYPKHTSANVT
jgi:hypothetical protein